MQAPLSEIFQVISGIEELKIHRSATHWLYGRWSLRYLPELLSFRTLRRLELITPLFVSSFLLSVIQQCPAIQDLKIENRKESPYMYWPEPKFLSFPITQLTHVEIKGCEGSPEEVEFAEFVLQNGKVLEEMKLLDIPADKEKSFQILIQQPRAKTGLCKVIFGKPGIIMHPIKEATHMDENESHIEKLIDITKKADTIITHEVDGEVAML
ncbi:hypothetical protein QL285_095951 [Trifolium repens]|nr:hypothetical protein QL285_095951 [Trifolium repens]